jgi:hypothetical protein
MDERAGAFERSQRLTILVSIQKAVDQPVPTRGPISNESTRLIPIPVPRLSEIETEKSTRSEISPSSIDWNAEAANAAENLTRSSQAHSPRALDQHSPGADLDAGLPPSASKKSEFGWDRAHTHRVETLEGGGTMIHLNDRCVIVLLGPIPFPVCGIGKIQARGDLFEHLNDAPKIEVVPRNAAP